MSLPELKAWLKREDREPLVILLVVPVILTLWVYYGKQGTLGLVCQGLQERWDQDLYGALYEYLAAFILMFGIPALIVRWLFRGRLRDWGLRVGDARQGVRYLAIGLPLCLLAAYVGSLDPAVRAAYPLARSAVGHLARFWTVEAFYLLYYLGWEFFFRGFMLFGLEKRYGPAIAILMQTIPSALVHIGKPASETFAAIAAGLIFGTVALRTRSIFYPLLLHAAVGIGTDVAVTLSRGG
jgi:membrane protease YdiL (CAAX protease family)